MLHSSKTSTEAALTQIAQIYAAWGQKHRVKHHDKPKSVLYNAMKLRISTINLTLSRGHMCHAGLKLYIHEDYFIFGHLHPDI